MSRFPCPYLKGEVELTEERERHVAERASRLYCRSIGGNWQRPWPTRTRSEVAAGTETPGCSRAGTLMSREASTWWWLSSASLTRRSVIGSHGLPDEKAGRRSSRMAAKLKFKYDREADILHIDKCPPYAEQDRRNCRTK